MNDNEARPFDSGRIIFRMAVLAGTYFALSIAVRTLVDTRLDNRPLGFVLEGLLIAIAMAAGWFIVVTPLRRTAAVERFEATLQRALALDDRETATLRVAGRAVASIGGSMGVELLLADSSDAHLEQAFTLGPESDAPSCPVDSPRNCAAINRGHTVVFRSSEALDACPYLAGRPTGPCSAACVPISVLGRSIGVLHATAADGTPPRGIAFVELESISRQVGARLGVIRALSQSQLQASTDPLTGLLNRRSLEDRVQDLGRSGMHYTVALCDLDFFKQVNDMFGHETGDRSLRVFARTLLGSVRQEDAVARYGGDEFVVVFPRVFAAEAEVILERVRTALGRTLNQAGMPLFTSSFGVADVSFDADFDRVMRAADDALLQAKESGRDRIVLAGAEPHAQSSREGEAGEDNGQQPRLSAA
jgi:diguanylate cyclase (GGDEF)-like protein